MHVYPTEIKRLSTNGISVSWSDGITTDYTSEKLRQNCPCAQCKHAHGDQSHEKPLTSKKSALRIIESSKEEELKLEKIWQVGQYAIGILWGDGHNTGIYTFNFLRGLAGSL